MAKGNRRARAAIKADVLNLPEVLAVMEAAEARMAKLERVAEAAKAYRGGSNVVGLWSALDDLEGTTDG